MSKWISRIGRTYSPLQDRFNGLERYSRKLIKDIKEGEIKLPENGDGFLNFLVEIERAANAGTHSVRDYRKHHSTEELAIQKHMKVTQRIERLKNDMETLSTFENNNDLSDYIKNIKLLANKVIAEFDNRRGSFENDRAKWDRHTSSRQGSIIRQ